MQEIIIKTQEYVKSILKNEFTGHDYYHAIRVKNIANKISQTEGGNMFIINIASLLHDVIDDKIQDSLNVNCQKFNDFFNSLNIDKQTKEEILYIMNNMSFSKMLLSEINITKELAIVSDADKIDSLGAIGIARTFAFGSKVNNKIYDPEILPEINLTQEEYKRKGRITTSLNHFDEKLLQLDKYLLTGTGKEIARSRIEFIRQFKEQFLSEWNYC
ncbi:MAG: HD domain-containing protein [Rickettsiales bacterium]|nr:HD domain-containing protein [Rickettsiales bacterium]